MKKLRKGYYEVLSRLAASEDAQLRKLPGGFWVTDQDSQEYAQGEWYAETSIVRQMRSMGLIKPTNDNDSPHVITDEGVKALNEAS